MTCRIWVASLAYNKGQRLSRVDFSFFIQSLPSTRTTWLYRHAQIELKLVTSWAASWETQVVGLFIQLTWIYPEETTFSKKIIIIIIIITIKKGSWLKSLNKSQLIPKSIYLISKYNLQNIQMIQIPQNLKILTKILNISS